MGNKKERIVVYSGTKNLYESMVTAVKSLLVITPIDKVYLLIEDDGIEGIPDFVDCIECINVSNQTYFPLDSPNAMQPLTYMVLMRAAYHKIFPKHSQVLSLDVDTLIIRDISSMWNYDLSGYYLAAVREPPCCTGGEQFKRDKYFNMGVAMLNLEKLRDGTGDKIIETINSGKTEAQEQGVFNEICAGQILEMSNIFNSGNYWTGYADYPHIHHFAGDRTWQKNTMIAPYRGIDFKRIMERQLKWREEGRITHASYT